MEFCWSAENFTKTILAITQKQEHSKLLAPLPPPLQHTQTRGSLNPIGPIAISSKWLSRELNRIGSQRWFSLGAFVAIDMELLLVFASLKLQFSTLLHGLYYISGVLGRRCIDPDLGGKFQRIWLTSYHLWFPKPNMGRWVKYVCATAPGRPTSGRDYNFVPQVVGQARYGASYIAVFTSGNICHKKIIENKESRLRKIHRLLPTHVRCIRKTALCQRMITYDVYSCNAMHVVLWVIELEWVLIEPL